MSKVVFLEALRNQKAAKRGFREWCKKFKDLRPPDEHTRWSDLPDSVILYLADEDMGGRQILYDLLMGALELGRGFEFESLPAEKLLPLLDAYFLLIDQVRFECLRRLGWIEEIPLGERPLIPLIRDYERGNYNTLTISPKLSPHHPSFPEYSRLPELDQRVFVRKSIPEAVRLFKQKTEQTG